MRTVIISVLLLIVFGLFCWGMFILGMWAGMDIMIDDWFGPSLSTVIELSRPVQI